LEGWPVLFLAGAFLLEGFFLLDGFRLRYTEVLAERMRLMVLAMLRC
jgi:hypothetical protein